MIPVNPLIAICIPSRGLIFTKTMKAIIDECRNYLYFFDYFFTDSLPIPLAHNIVLQQAMDSDHRFDYFLFLEEDVIIPPRGIEKLLLLNTDVAFINYGVNGFSCAATRSTGDVLWVGTGCTLIKREVLKRLNYPWFQSNKALRMNDWTWINVNPDTSYGMQDIRFGHDIRKLGFTIKVVEGMECDHLQLDTVGNKEINNGCHKISLKPSITTQNIIDPPSGI